MAHFIMVQRDDRYWLVGPFATQAEGGKWACDTYALEDDPRWQTIELAGPSAAPPVLTAAEGSANPEGPPAIADDFAAQAAALLASAREGDTVVVAVVQADGGLVIHTRSDQPQHLAQVAANLADEVAERLDMAGDALEGAEQAGLLIACQDATALLREALGDD